LSAHVALPPQYHSNDGSTGDRLMQATQTHIYARRLLETQGWKAIAEAAQKARGYERSNDVEQAQAWRRIEAALLNMRGPSET
jgi:hypothetical protein